MTTHTFESLISRYSADLTRFTEQPAATAVDAFIEQVACARDILATAMLGQMQDASEELDAATTYLTYALDSTADEQRVLLAMAHERLRDAIELSA
ncbi:hypothetical protein ACQUSR_05740 [Streptomyces sp. P1-3]|uniref:hypothetical protein n=1 Tax=Streptomyces sp. P1-3 TaxID=3421658 RepID=UPI003D362AB5